MDWNFLIEHIEPGALLLDCRSEQAYGESTLKGAYGAAAVKKPFGSGPKSQALLSGFVNGILAHVEDDRPVITFDEGQGMYACRMAWILVCAGVKNVRVFAHKIAEVDRGEFGEGPGQIGAEPANQITPFKGIVPITFMQKNLTRLQLLDVRTPQEYEGELPRMVNPEAGAICGRIPGSMNWDWRLLYGPDGHLREKMPIIQEIRRMGLIQERPTVLYDYNGARSCTTALVLNSCGYRQTHVYLGSWMEWRKTNMPKQNVGAWNP